MGKIALTRKPRSVANVLEDPDYKEKDLARKEGLVSMLSIPILFYEESIGVIRIYHSEKKKINEDDIDALKVLAEHLGIVIEYNGLKNFLEKVYTAVESLPARTLKSMI